MTLDEQFNALNDKLQALIRDYQRQQREGERLRSELEAARQGEAQSRQQLEEARQQIGILKSFTGEASEKDRKDFDRRLAQYIREIDKVLAFLNTRES